MSRIARTRMINEPNKDNEGYAKGFVDGYAHGVYHNPYGGDEDSETLYEHEQYKFGYDAGVSLYCTEIHGDEINV